jgi:hypothetical protein
VSRSAAGGYTDTACPSPLGVPELPVVGVPRAFLPAGRKLVELQAFERGHWITFKTLRTGKGGSFRTTYRFNPSTRGTFPMRVRVVREAAGPFEPATSKRVVVRVT